MNALTMHANNTLRHEFKRLLGRYPDAWAFETPNTLWARIDGFKVWLTSYPDGVLKFDDALARALADKPNAKTMILEGA
jgi:hypothetical protein